MIEMLTGICRAKTAHSVIIDVNGVGYGVEMPLSSLCELGPIGSDVQVWIHTHVREDVIKLFGFLTMEERSAFLMLLQVSGVGPKVALSILSAMDTGVFKAAILQNKPKVLESVPGIGKKLAERLVLELKGKVEKLATSGRGVVGGRYLTRLEDVGLGDSEEAHVLVAGEPAGIMADLASALGNLGFKEKDISPVLARLNRPTSHELDSKLPPKGEDFSFLLRQALIELRSGAHAR